MARDNLRCSSDNHVPVVAGSFEGNTEKAQKVSNKASSKMHSDVAISRDQLQHPGVKAQKLPETVKTGAQKAVSGVKTAEHGAGSKLKKKK